MPTGAATILTGESGSMTSKADSRTNNYHQRYHLPSTVPLPPSTVPLLSKIYHQRYHFHHQRYQITINGTTFNHQRYHNKLMMLLNQRRVSTDQAFKKVSFQATNYPRVTSGLRGERSPSKSRKDWQKISKRREGIEI